MSAVICLCDYALRPLGILHGVNMGMGRVRITTHPQCPAHSLCRHFTKDARAERRYGEWLWCPVHKKKDCPSEVAADERD